ncbi:AAA family ATPase, partial [Streptomyces sp. NPDC058375]|uniref:AAA family ATPase n=1 Tax=Streptomyces sp. NPDC058375 TaxID=3346467 RepID=UPI00364853B7
MPKNSADRAGGRPSSHDLTPVVLISAGLVVLVGPPASGKTSFVRALVERRQIDAEAVVSSDEIRADLSGAPCEPASAASVSAASVSAASNSDA